MKIINRICLICNRDTRSFSNNSYCIECKLQYYINYITAEIVAIVSEEHKNITHLNYFYAISCSDLDKMAPTEFIAYFYRQWKLRLFI